MQHLKIEVKVDGKVVREYETTISTPKNTFTEFWALVAEKAVTEAYQRGYATGQEEIEKERDALRALVVMRSDHDYPPQFTQGHDLHELTEPVTAEHCRWFVAEIERLRTDCDALREKIVCMERHRKCRGFSDDLLTTNEALEKARAASEKSK